MPGGRCFGQGCGRSGQRKLFFLESCLLMLLYRAPNYGYKLMNGLQEFGFQTEQMDFSILYRALRALETEELINGVLDENSRGPQRRIYTITSQGKITLAEWIEAIRQRRIEIETLEAAYYAVKKLSGKVIKIQK